MSISTPIVASLLAITCTSSPQITEQAGTTERCISETQTAPAADRAAILAMVGAFEVSFRFEETVAVDDGYELTEPYNESATELVTVIADEGDYISLQHVLVVDAGSGDPIIVKHWRQDWRYQDTDVLAYVGHSTWQHDHRDADAVQGSWTQAVFQTTDAPRYEAVGRWTHLGENSSWESEITWRPLPRRERQRKDYDVVQCRNRHTITPSGWVHEQDNQKLAIDGDGAQRLIVAHESGLNTYTRVSEDAVSHAHAYWSEHAETWAMIRDAWEPVMQRDRFTLQKTADGQRLSSVVDDAIEEQSALHSLSERIMAFVTE